MQWTKAQYFENAISAAKATSIVRTVLPKAKSINSKFGEVHMLSVPQAVIESDLDPVTESVNAQKPIAIFLQLDPLLYLSRHRFLRHIAASVETKGNSQFTMKNYVPKDIDECTVNLLDLDLLTKKKTLKHQESFMLYMTNEIGQKNNEEMTKSFISAIHDYVYSSNSRWPYLDAAVYPSVMSRVSVILGDIPEAHLRCIVGNTITVDEARKMMAHVVSILEKHFSKNKWLLTSAHITQMLYSHVFAARDRYVAALLRDASLKYKKVDAWLGVNHVAPVTAMWDDIPNYEKAAHIPPRIAGETDEDLIEKQVILDLLNETQVWNHPAISNPFPYITDSPSPEVLKRSKQTFHELITFYQKSISDTVKIPEELMKEIDDLSNKQD